MNFLAIDFETADFQSDSACAVGLVRVERGRIVHRESHLIKPPRRHIIFTYLHGITWEDVRESPTFGELWPSIKGLFEGVDFLVAHNASFDSGVLASCCSRYGIHPPRPAFQCTMKQARRLWNIRPTRLPDVCRRFGIPLNHHDAASDTEACARIMMLALQEHGFRLI